MGILRSPVFLEPGCAQIGTWSSMDYWTDFGEVF